MLLVSGVIPAEDQFEAHWCDVVVAIAVGVGCAVVAVAFHGCCSLSSMVTFHKIGDRALADRTCPSGARGRGMLDCVGCTGPLVDPKPSTIGRCGLQRSSRGARKSIGSCKRLGQCNGCVCCSWDWQLRPADGQINRLTDRQKGSHK